MTEVWIEAQSNCCGRTGGLKQFPVVCVGSGEWHLKCSLVSGNSSIGCSFVDLKIIMNYVMFLEKKAVQVPKQVPTGILGWFSGEWWLTSRLSVSVDCHLRVSMDWVDAPGSWDERVGPWREWLANTFPMKTRHSFRVTMWEVSTQSQMYHVFERSDRLHWGPGDKV